MATRRWQGGAAAVAQVTTLTPANVEVGDTFTVTINNKSITVTATDTTVANVTGLMAAAWNASTVPEFAEVTAEDSTTHVTLTADTPGVPFTVAATEADSGGGTDNQTFTASTTTSSAGPSHWDDADNWSTNTVPTTGDDVIIDQGDDDIKYGLDQNSIDLQSLRITNTFSGTLGLPDVNTDGGEYFEYRQKDLKVGFSGGTTTCTVGEGPGNGSGRIRIDFDGATGTTLRVYATGSGLDSDIAPLQIANMGTTSTVEVFGGELDINYKGGESGDVTTFRQTGGTVRMGSGTDLTTGTQTIDQQAGTLEVNSACDTILQKTTAGTITIRGSGAIASLTTAGTVNHQGTGTVTTLVNKGVFNRDNTVAITITNISHYSGASFIDRYGSVTDTNGHDFVQCGVEDLSTFQIGNNYTLTKTAI